jgi:ankyrin repeat protein
MCILWLHLLWLCCCHGCICGALLHLQDGDTALRIACRNGHLDVARLLLDSGAKVDATNKVGCWRLCSSSVPCISLLHADARCPQPVTAACGMSCSLAGVAARMCHLLAVHSRAEVLHWAVLAVCMIEAFMQHTGVPSWPAA